jgi:hypothetical protein
MKREEVLGIPFVAATATSGPGTLFTCPLCGGLFSHGEEVCGACPLRPRCDVVGCPHCGYVFPRTSAIVETLGRLGRWLAGRKT